MSIFTKPQAVLICDPNREDLPMRKLESVLRRLADFSLTDCAGFKSLADLEKALAESGQESTIFIDTKWLGAAKAVFHPDWLRRKVVLVKSDDGPESAAPNVPEWQHQLSCLCLRRIANADLPRILQLALSPERYPGVVVLSERNGEIFFEKVHQASEIGQKTDHLLSVLEAKHPVLRPQLFNLRQLSYAVLHQAFLAANSASKILPVVDFQITANPERIVFAAQFNAPEGTLAQWLAGMAARKNLIWHNAQLSADLLAFTELRELKEIEFKAVISRAGEFAGEREKSMLVHRLENFHADAITLEAQKAAKLKPLLAVEGEAAAFEQKSAAAQTHAAEEAESAGLQFKLKAEVLEGENGSLQGLVKKKTHLLAEQNKEMNRLQKELLQAKNAASKDVHGASAEAEKARSDLRKVTEKLVRLQKKVAENEAAAGRAGGTAAAGAGRDFEKEWKQTDLARRLAEEKLADLKAKFTHQEELIPNLRKELNALNVEVTELRAANFRLEKTAGARAREDHAKEELAAQKNAVAEDGLNEKLREMQKQSRDSKTREQLLETEVKRLTLKLESVEKNMKINQLTFEKQAAQAERLIEETKKQKNDALKRLEESGAGAKAKGDESGAERVLKKKAEELSSLLAKKTAEFEKQSADLKKKILSQNAKIEELTAQLSDLQKKQKAA